MRFECNIGSPRIQVIGNFESAQNLWLADATDMADEKMCVEEEQQVHWASTLLLIAL